MMCISSTRDMVILVLLGSVLAGVAGPTFSQQKFSVQACVSEYLDAFASARRLEDKQDCPWSKMDSLEAAAEVQESIVVALGGIDELAGYKVSRAGDGRVIGTLLTSMLLENGGKIRVASAASLIGEADLLVRISDDRVNQAETLEDVARFIDAVIPFIESSDMMLPQGTPRIPPTWTASNGNARWGVVGEPIPVTGDASLVQAMASVTATLTDGDGNQLVSASMSRNPLESVLDVVRELQRRGGAGLKTGDLVSLGNFGRPARPEAGQVLTATYNGIGTEPVSVTVQYE